MKILFCVCVPRKEKYNISLICTELERIREKLIFMKLCPFSTKIGQNSAAALSGRSTFYSALLKKKTPPKNRPVGNTLFMYTVPYFIKHCFLCPPLKIPRSRNERLCDGNPELWQNLDSLTLGPILPPTIFWQSYRSKLRHNIFQRTLSNNTKAN